MKLFCHRKPTSVLATVANYISAATKILGPHTGACVHRPRLQLHKCMHDGLTYFILSHSPHLYNFKYRL